MPDDDFDRAVERYRQALGALLKGDPSHVADLFSRGDDVTLANPLGPPRLGRVDVEKAITEAAAHFTDGSVRCEEVSRYSTPELGYVVQLERAELQLAGQDDMRPSTLRVTMIFRREGDAWRVVHRHADPITTPQPINTVLDTWPTGPEASAGPTGRDHAMDEIAPDPRVGAAIAGRRPPA